MEMTLTLDYAVYTPWQYVVMRKEDKAGLVTFEGTLIHLSPSTRTNAGGIEAPHARLHGFKLSLVCVRRTAGAARAGTVYQFLIISSPNRQIVVATVNRQHRLLVIFFEDAALKSTSPLLQRIRKGITADIGAKFAYSRNG